MADDLRLLPAGIDDERARALTLLIDRLGDIDLTPLLIYRLKEVPDEALHLLAWQFHVLGSEGWELAETSAERRALIRRALALHRRKGTPWSMREAIRSLGYADAEIVEGLPVALYDGEQNHSGAETYGGGTRWAMFRVVLDLGEDKGITVSHVERLIRLIETWKNQRSQLTDIGFRAGVADEVALSEATDWAFAHEGQDILPWGRRYDGSIDHDGAARRLHDGSLAYDSAADHSGWDVWGARHDSTRVTLDMGAGLGLEDAVAVAPTHDGRFRYSGISYGAGQPSIVDAAMPVSLVTHRRYNGRYTYAGDHHDGAITHDGTRSYFTGAVHDGLAETRSNVI